LGLKRFSKENSTKLCFSSLSSFNGHEWMFGVSVSFGGSLLHLKLTPSKLTP
jgi:hypothetical protein